MASNVGCDVSVVSDFPETFRHLEDIKITDISRCINKLPPSSIEELDNEFMRIFGEKGSYLLHKGENLYVDQIQ